MPSITNRTHLIRMLILTLVLSTVDLIGGVVLQAADPPASDADAVKLFVPAYFYPAGEGRVLWNRLLAGSKQTPIVAIANPDSGPGKAVDANYRELIREAQSTPLQIIGYVTHSYGKRPVSAIKGEIDSWLYFYPEIRGIFFDEQSSQPGEAAAALEVFAYARSRISGGTFVSNPGVPCAREYLSGHDAPASCMFEHQDAFDKFQPPEWVHDLGRDKLVILLYNLKGADAMRTQLREAIRKRGGLIYITDRVMPNPWDGLASYFDDELAALEEYHRGQRSGAGTGKRK